MVTLKYVTQNGGCLPTFCSFIDSGGALKKKSYRAKGRTDDISWRMALVVLYSRPPHPPHKFTDKLNWHISCSRNPRPSIITRHQLGTQFKDTALSVPLAAPPGTLDRLLRTIVVGVILWHGSLLHPAGDDAPTHDSFWSQGHENSLTHSLHNNNTTNDNNNNTILKGFAADDGNYIMWVVAITQSVDVGCSAAD